MNKRTVNKILKNLVDYYGDFYITKQNLRFSIKENIDLLSECVKAGDKVFLEEKGVAVVLGYSDNAFRKYVKVLSSNKVTADKLLKSIDAEINEQLWVKIKKNNPLRSVFEQNKYRVYANRGNEILLTNK